MGLPSQGEDEGRGNPPPSHDGGGRRGRRKLRPCVVSSSISWLRPPEREREMLDWAFWREILREKRFQRRFPSAEAQPTFFASFLQQPPPPHLILPWFLTRERKLGISFSGGKEESAWKGKGSFCSDQSICGSWRRYQGERKKVIEKQGKKCWQNASKTWIHKEGVSGLWSIFCHMNVLVGVL